ncbi:DUF4105 domain-containing protein [Polluticoccus soli]|uniref:Lnb N-terminal periplasmic domain-containing protein n=1 Tax=Polluticoccus soli TaxID=3034150 RepID=UPI0023E2AE94|nr:DUF4105 domain-containing protein [Flavipsychrobacter sp. JY13-12]
MYKKLVLLCLLFSWISVSAQTDSSRLRISLLTCGTGPEVWETFGHTALRVTDSSVGTDMVYNYGTFAFDDDFALQFMRGKLLYYLSFYPYEAFLHEYASAQRSVEEQVLLLNGRQKQQLYEFLQHNAQSENRSYKYDFFYDNCATRIRDAFPRTLGKGFEFGKTAAATNRLTFRNIINQYYYYKHWERFGINILLGSKIDKVMTNEDIMFLPDFLSDGIVGARLNGERISTDRELIIPGSVKQPTGVNWPMVTFLIIGVITILGLTVKSLKPLGNVMSFLLLFITGLLGVLMMVMWLGTDHQGCSNNTNLLWALPTNLILAFATKRNKGKYAIIAIVLMVLALLLHLLRVQELPLLQLWPLLLTLMFIYGTIYRRNKLKSS